MEKRVRIRLNTEKFEMHQFKPKLEISQQKSRESLLGLIQDFLKNPGIHPIYDFLLWKT